MAIVKASSYLSIGHIHASMTPSIIVKIITRAELDQMPDKIETSTKIQPHHLIKFTGVDHIQYEQHDNTEEYDNDNDVEIQNEIQTYEQPKEYNERNNAVQETEASKWIDIFESTEGSNSESEYDSEEENENPGYKELLEQMAEAEN